MANRGRQFALAGKPSEAVETLTAAIAAYKSAGTTLFTIEAEKLLKLEKTTLTFEAVGDGKIRVNSSSWEACGSF
jgi:hypothetical protein